MTGLAHRRRGIPGLIPALLAGLCLLAAAGSISPALGAEGTEEVFLNRSQELADLLGLLSHPDPGTTLEAQCDLLDRIQGRIGEIGTCFFKGFDGRPREVREELRSRFEALPAEVRQAYRRRIDPQATELWKSGIAGDAGVLRAILARFPLSSFAPRSARLLARMAAESGHYSEALRELHRSGFRTDAAEAGDLLLAAFCHWRTGWREKARDLASLALRHETSRPRAESFLRSLDAPASLRGAERDGGFVPAPKSAYALAPPDLDGQALDSLRRQGIRPQPASFPASDGRRIFAANRRCLRAIDRETGRVLWAFPDDPEGHPAGRDWGAEVRPVVSGDRVAVSFGDFLAVFDVQTGKVLWHFGSPTVIPPPPAPRASPELPKPSAIAPPIPVGEDWLVALTASGGSTESSLLRFDPGGELRWVLFLASGPSPRYMAYVPFPRISVEGDVAFVSTGTGAVAAVALDGPRFLWGHVSPFLSSGVRSVLDSHDALARGLDPVFRAPFLYFMAEETGTLMALDGLTGEVAWNFAAPSGAVFAGIEGDRVIVCGRREILGLDRWTGKTLWATAVPKPGTIGAPATTRGRVHVPHEGGILTLLAESGAPIASLGFEDGRLDGLNLVATRDGILGAGFDEVLHMGDGSREAMGVRGRVLALLSQDLFAEAVRALEGARKDDAGIAPSLMRFASCEAASYGDLDAARRFLELLAERCPESTAERGRALVALGNAEADAGNGEEALTHFSEALAVEASANVSAGSVSVPFRTAALDRCKKLLTHPGIFETWERRARDAFASLPRPHDKKSLSDFRASYPFSTAGRESLCVEPGDGVLPEQLRGLWREGVDVLEPSEKALEALGRILTARDHREGELVLSRLGHAAGAGSVWRAPRLAGWPVAELWRRPVHTGAPFPVEVRALSGPKSGEPGAFMGDEKAIERIHPRFGWTQWRTELGTWTGEAVRVQEVLVVATYGTVRGLDASTGKALWFGPVGFSEMGSGLFSEEGRSTLIPGRRCACIAFRTGRVFGYDARTGERAWEGELGDGSPVLIHQDPQSGKAYLHFAREDRIRTVDPDRGLEGCEDAPTAGRPFALGQGRFLVVKKGLTGTELSEVRIPGGSAGWRSSVKGSYDEALVDPKACAAVLLPVQAGGTSPPVLCLDVGTGAVRWTLPGSALPRSFLLAAGRLFSMELPSVVAAYSLETGKPAWKSVVPGLDARNPVWCASGLTLAVAGAAGTISFLDPTDGSTCGNLFSPAGPADGLSFVGCEGLLVSSAHGRILLGTPPRPGEFLPLLEEEGASPYLHYVLAATRGDPVEGVRRLEGLVWGEDELEVGPGHLGHFNLVNLVEGSAFDRPPVIRARRFAEKPKMDGELEEAWSRAEVVQLGVSSLRFMPKGRVERTWSGENDISARIFTGWDEDAFYLAVDLIDDRPRVPHDASSREWDGDVVVFALDRAGDGGFRLNTPEDEVVWLFWPKPDAQQNRRDEGRDREREAQNRGVKPRPGDNGMVIEMAFPWEERFNSRLRSVGRRADLIGPRPGDCFGLNLLFLDDDGSGPGHYLALAPGLRFTRRTGGFDTQIPQYWAKVELR